jgi:tetratricopeptide (TPR) repeat protein
MNKVFLAIISCVLCSSSAVAGETFSSDSDSWQDNYAKGRNAIEARDFANAAKYLDKAKAIAKTFKPGDSRLAATSSELLVLDDKINDHGKSRDHLIEQRDSYIKAFGPTYCQVGTTDGTLAGEYLALGKPAEAEKLYKTAISIIQQNFGGDNLKLAEMFHNCAVAQWRMGKSNEALQTIQKEATILQKSGANCDQKLIGSLLLQADILESLNKPKEAQGVWSKYYALTGRNE